MKMNQSGFSLGYLMVVMGIGMIIALALSSMTVDSLRGAKNVEQSFEINNLALEVQAILQSTTACENSYLGLSPNGAIFVADVKDKTGASRFAKDTTYGSSDVIINGYSFGIKDHAGANMNPPIGASTTGISNLRISIKKTSQASGASIVERRIPIFVKTDAAGTVETCSARPISGGLQTREFSCKAPRNGNCSEDTTVSYPGVSFDFCALQVVRSGGDEGGGKDTCGVKSTGVGTWQIYGKRGDDPAIECRMICMAMTDEPLPAPAAAAPPSFEDWCLANFPACELEPPPGPPL